MKRKILWVLLLLCTLVFTACGKENITEAEVREVLPTLVENSVTLNEIYFGEGFVPDANLESNVSGYYYANSMAAGFASISEIKDATEAVFTPEYAAILYGAAFEGMHTDTSVVAPRYVEGEMGILQSMHAVVYALPVREYLYDTVQIVEKGTERTTISVDTVANGETVTVQLLLVRTETLDGYKYRLDSPTY